MKTIFKVCIAMAAICGHYSSLSQRYYIFNKAINLATCALDGTNVGAFLTPIDATLKFEMMRVLVDDKTQNVKQYVIHILESETNDDINERLVYEKTNDKLDRDKPIYFSIAPTDLSANAAPLPDTRLRGGFVAGPLITPLKLRFGSRRHGIRQSYFDVVSDVNLGIAAGQKWDSYTKHDSPYSLALLGAVSVTQIAMDSSTTNGKLKTTAKIPGASFTAALVFVKGSFQLGLMVGIDKPTGSLDKSWAYRNMPYIGIGLGATLFQSSSTNIPAIYSNGSKSKGRKAGGKKPINSFL